MKSQQQKNNFFAKRALAFFVLTIVICLHAYFSLQRIRTFTGGDETLWSYERVPGFWQAVEKGNWKKTNISDKPGITLAMISGIGLFFSPDPQKYGDLMYEAKSAADLQAIENMYFYLRLPILIFGLLSLIAFYFLIDKLLGEKIALLSIVFIGLAPNLVGMSDYINSDSILWIFLPMTILSFLVFQKFPERKYLILTGILLGLSLITKYVAAILLPFFLFAVCYDYFLSPTENSKKSLKNGLFDWLMIVLIASLTVFALYPVSWVKPQFVLETTILSKPFLKIMPLVFLAASLSLIDSVFLRQKFAHMFSEFVARKKHMITRMLGIFALLLIVFTFTNVYSGMKMVDTILVLSDPRAGSSLQTIIGQFFPNLLSAFYSMIFGLVPLAAFLFVVGVIIFLRSSNKSTSAQEKYEHYFFGHVLMFVLVYYLASAIMAVSPMMRYQVALFPLVLILVAIALHWLLQAKMFYLEKFSLIVLAIIGILSVSLILSKPYFWEYSNDLLPKKYMVNLDNSGAGSFEVASYLNGLSNAQNLYIWSDVRQVCEKFVGKCAFGLKGWQNTNEHFDYFVFTVQEAQNNLSWADKNGKLKIGSTMLDYAQVYDYSAKSAYNFEIDQRPFSSLKVIKNEN